MNGYLNTVIITVTACQIAQMITQNTEAYKRIVHIMCAMVVLLTIAQPLRWIVLHLEEAVDFVQGMTEQEAAENTTKDPLEMTAQAVMEHASTSFDLDSDGMKIVLITDDRDGTLTEIQLFVSRCAYAQRENASEKMTEIYGVPVYIYSNRGE